MSEPARRRGLAITLRIISAAVLVGLVALAIWKIDWAQVGAALAHASFPLVLAAAALNFANLACKAARWQVMLSPLTAPRRVGSARSSGNASTSAAPTRSTGSSPRRVGSRTSAIPGSAPRSNTCARRRLIYGSTSSITS